MFGPSVVFSPRSQLRSQNSKMRVFVDDLDDRDGRLVAVFGFRVRVEVREQLPGVIALQLEQPLADERHPLARC